MPPAHHGQQHPRRLEVQPHLPHAHLVRGVEVRRRRLSLPAARAGYDQERERSHCESLHYGSVLVAGAAGAAGAVVVVVLVVAGIVAGIVAGGAVVVAAGAGSAGWLMPMRVS